MKISTRISIVFSLVSSLVLILFGLGIYLQSKSHTEFVFSERLKKRVNITERFFLEKNSFTEAEFEKIRNQFLHTLPQEKEEVIELNKTPKFNYTYSDNLKLNLVKYKDHSFTEHNLQGASKIFYVDGIKYLVIVTAVDELGNSNLMFLLKRISLFIGIGILILFTLFITLTKRSFRPLSKKIERANNISASNLDKRLIVQNPKDEIGQMSIAFNKLLDRLEKSFEAQKSFISNASHEIKNPLTAIMGEAEIASSKLRSSEEYLASFSIILTESERLNLTVNNLLQLSKVNANGFSISFKKTNFDTFLISLIKSYGFINQNHQLEYRFIAKNTVYINCNSGLLKTALTNVFDNACKFSNNQKVDISLDIINKECILTIKDNGIGIPLTDIEKIAQPFYRASNTILVKGSGIGLSLTKKIIELHNGNILIESKENIGTIIKISLPMVQL